MFNIPSGYKENNYIVFCSPEGNKLVQVELAKKTGGIFANFRKAKEDAKDSIPVKIEEKGVIKTVNLSVSSLANVLHIDPEAVLNADEPIENLLLVELTKLGSKTIMETEDKQIDQNKSEAMQMIKEASEGLQKKGYYSPNERSERIKEVNTSLATASRAAELRQFNRDIGPGITPCIINDRDTFQIPSRELDPNRSPKNVAKVNKSEERLKDANDTLERIFENDPEWMPAAIAVLNQHTYLIAAQPAFDMVPIRDAWTGVDGRDYQIALTYRNQLNPPIRMDVIRNEMGRVIGLKVTVESKLDLVLKDVAVNPNKPIPLELEPVKTNLEFHIVRDKESGEFVVDPETFKLDLETRT